MPLCITSIFAHTPVSPGLIQSARYTPKAFTLKIQLIAFISQIMIPLEDIQRRIVELEVEHRDLDAVIDLLTRDVLHDELQLRRLKKRKLQLKDHITLLKMQLIPDIPA